MPNRCSSGNGRRSEVLSHFEVLSSVPHRFKLGWASECYACSLRTPSTGCATSHRWPCATSSLWAAALTGAAGNQCGLGRVLFGPAARGRLHRSRSERKVLSGIVEFFNCSAKTSKHVDGALLHVHCIAASSPLTSTRTTTRLCAGSLRCCTSRCEPMLVLSTPEREEFSLGRPAAALNRVQHLHIWLGHVPVQHDQGKGSGLAPHTQRVLFFGILTLGWFRQLCTGITMRCHLKVRLALVLTFFQPLLPAGQDCEGQALCRVLSTGRPGASGTCSTFIPGMGAYAPEID